MTRREELEALRVVVRRNAQRDLSVLRRGERGTPRHDRKLEEVAGAARLLVAFGRLLALDDVELAAVRDVDDWLGEVAVGVSFDDAMEEVARLRGWSGLVVA